MRLRWDGFDVFSLFLMGAAGALAVALLLTGCAPQTDLVGAASGGDDRGGAGSPGPGGGALIDPAAGTIDVPINLAALVIAFPTAVTLPAEALRVCAGPDPPVVVGPPEPVPCPSGTCYRAPLTAALPAAQSCRVEIGAGALDAAGQPLPSGLLGVFDTAASPDDTPPLITGVTVQVMGPCIEVRFSTDEPATGAVVLRAGDAETAVPAGAGQTDFDMALPAGLLPAGAAATVAARATDRAGNVAESAPLALTTPPALPPVAITEVMANPAGTEPAQEYVELRNMGDADLALDGLVIQDSRGGDMLPPGTLVSGGYALVVTSAYDPMSGADPPPRPGTLLLRVDTRIGTDGLSNSGEVVRLVRGDAVVSSYGGWVDVSSTAWSGKAVHRLVQTACDRPDAWNRTPLPPTPGAGPP
jgi:Lamin Tail Domain